MFLRISDCSVPFNFNTREPQGRAEFSEKVSDVQKMYWVMYFVIIHEVTYSEFILETNVLVFSFYYFTIDAVPLFYWAAVCFMLYFGMVNMEITLYVYLTCIYLTGRNEWKAVQMNFLFTVLFLFFFSSVLDTVLAKVKSDTLTVFTLY